MKHRRLLQAAPLLLAAFVAMWSLRGLEANNIIDTDAARHAMNGAFVRDLVASGSVLQPIEYGKQYYGRLPSLSMPYHPPLFPAIEALFFWALGVNLFAARLAVALAAGVAVYLLYRLILATHSSHALAAAVVLTFFLWPPSQLAAADVMLEFPALAFLLGAIWCLRGIGHEYSLRAGILFALLAGAGVWSKQHAVFLGLVPFAYIILSRRFRLLGQKTIWISSALFGAQVIGLWMLNRPFNRSGGDQAPPPNEFGAIAIHNADYYRHALGRYIGDAGVLLLVGILLLSLIDAWAERRLVGRALYPAWAATGLLMLLWLGAYDIRYLMFVLPPLVVMAYAALARLARMVSLRWAWVAPAAVAAAFAARDVTMPTPFLRGPAESAAAVLQHSPKRVLYCGMADGNFIFSVRSLDRSRSTAVLSGDRLPPSVFEVEAFEKFAHRYGVEYVLIEYPAKDDVPYFGLAETPTRSMVLEREITMDSYPPRWRGRVLRMYRFTNPSPHPEDMLLLNVNKLAPSMEFRL